MRRRDFLGLAGAALIAQPARAAADWQHDFADYVTSQMPLANAPGVAVAMTRGGKTVFSAGYGFANLDPVAHVTPDTIFQIASVSKTVTATAVMLLWQRGAFKLDDSIAPHLDFPVVNPKFADTPITFRHLFTHTSGISDAVYDDMDFSTGPLPALRKFLADYLSSPKAYADTKPGTVWSYSNVGAALLGHLGEKLSGQTLDVFTHESIFMPLGMFETTWRYENVSDKRLAQPFAFEGARYKRLPRARYPDWPAGLLCTTANDFAKFLASYTKGGHALLRPETIATMFTPDPAPMQKGNPNLRQGLIWELAPLDGATIALHPGGDPGAATLAAVDTAHGTAALTFANISPDKPISVLEKDVIHRLLERGRTAT